MGKGHPQGESLPPKGRTGGLGPESLGASGRAESLAFVRLSWPLV